MGDIVCERESNDSKPEPEELKYFDCRRQDQACQNQGQCGQSGACQCGQGYLGFDCAIDTQTWSTENCSLPCENGGTCYGSDADMKCWCSQDFVGDLCQTDRVEVDCFANETVVTFHAMESFRGLARLGVQMEEGCELELSHTQHTYTVKIPNTGKCNSSESFDNETQVTTYSHQLNIQHHKDFITKLDQKINLSCGIFSSQSEIETEADIVVVDNDDNAPDISVTSVPVKLSVFEASGGDKKSEVIESMELGDTMYLINYLENTQVYKTLKAENCTAIDVPNNATLDIINEGCPTEVAAPLFYSAGNMTQLQIDGVEGTFVGQMFRMQTFKLHPTTDKIVIQCSVKVCREDNLAQCDLPDCGDLNYMARRGKLQRNKRSVLPLLGAGGHHDNILRVKVMDRA